METFTKLFSSITRSSVWLEDDQTLRVWITMLALADRNGYVGASVGGLAHIARVPRDKTEESLRKFMAPDADSRSSEHDGRRIEEADRGWVILNHGRYRDMRDEEARKTYFREQKRKSRLAVKAKSEASKNKRPRRVSDMSSMSTHAESDTEKRSNPMSPLVTSDSGGENIRPESSDGLDVCPFDGEPWGEPRGGITPYAPSRHDVERHNSVEAYDYVTGKRTIRG